MPFKLIARLVAVALALSTAGCASLAPDIGDMTLVKDAIPASPGILIR